MILHADKEGMFDRIEISKDLRAEIVEEDLWVTKGEYVNSFNGANDAIGTLVLRFEDEKTMAESISNIPSWLKTVVL